ncbi:MAG: hypothetical protein IKP92_08360 [Lachnospiraceae bacterium]|nr:hypothetical protein [Lachnospiraceae bacterium]
MKQFRNKIGKIAVAATVAAFGAFFIGCTTEMDHYDNAIKQEQKYVETISDAKDRDSEVEQQYEDIIEDDDGESDSQAQSEEVRKEDSEVVSEEKSEPKKTGNLTFRKKKYLDEHYEKHGKEMGFANAEEYLAAANAVVVNPDALHKKEKEDNDDIYYVEATNEFVVVSSDGYIRTYFNPSGGIDYYNRQ